MNEFNSKKIILLYLTGCVFILLVMMLGFYNRLAIDDYAYLMEEKMLGIVGATRNTYMTWDTRWVGFLIMNTALKVYEKTDTLIWYHVFSVLALVLSLHFLLRQLFDRKDRQLSSLIILPYALLLAAGFFFLTFGIGETWFWLNSSVTYFWPIVFACAGLAFTLRKRKPVLDGLFGFLFFFLAGGSSYEFAPVLLLGFLAYLISAFYRSENTLKKFLSAAENRKVGIALVGCAIGFATNYFGPGNSVRKSAEPAASFIQAFPLTGIAFIKMTLLYVFPKIPYLIFFSAPWMFLGDRLGKGQVKESRTELLRLFWRGGVLFVFVAFIALFIPTYLLSEMGPNRALTQISFYLIGLSSLFCFYLGYKMNLPQKTVQYGFYLSVFTCLSILCITFVTQQRAVSAYAHALDERTSHLLDLKKQGNRAWVKVEPLPASGFLYSAEITTDTADFSNVQYQKGLFLNFKVSRK